jgi:tetratricopeptide (TPR) repeat protein
MNNRDAQVIAEEKGQAAFQLFLQGDYTESERIFLETLDVLKEVSQENIFFALCLEGLGQLYLCQDRLDASEKYYREALNLYESYFSEYQFGIFSALCRLAKISELKGALADAESLYQRALRLGEKVCGESTVLAFSCLEGYEELLTRLGQAAEATAVRTRIDSIINANKR